MSPFIATFALCLCFAAVVVNGQIMPGSVCASLGPYMDDCLERKGIEFERAEEAQDQGNGGPVIIGRACASRGPYARACLISKGKQAEEAAARG